MSRGAPTPPHPAPLVHLYFKRKAACTVGAASTVYTAPVRWQRRGECISHGERHKPLSLRDAVSRRRGRCGPGHPAPLGLAVRGAELRSPCFLNEVLASSPWSFSCWCCSRPGGERGDPRIIRGAPGALSERPPGSEDGEGGGHCGPASGRWIHRDPHAGPGRHRPRPWPSVRATITNLLPYIICPYRSHK